MKRLKSIFGVFLCLFAVTFANSQFTAAAIPCPDGIAHKGNTYWGAPVENSLGAFQTSFNIGANWVETDVHFTSDSVPVIMHNATVEATTNGTGAIANMTAAQFTALLLDNGNGQHPPTLDQLLALVQADPQRKLLLEVKATNVSTAQEQILLQKLQGMESQVQLMAFANRFPTVQHLKTANPAFTISILGYDPISPSPAGIVSQDLEYTYLTPTRVANLHAQGLKVKAWTANNATAWNSLRNMGVDTIITNKISDYMQWVQTTCPAPTPVAPTVSLSAPLNNATVSGTQTISATAADADGTVSSVQFQLDGVNLGTAVATAPYTYDWDSTSVADGTHTLRAIATDNSSLQTTSSSVSVTVDNTVDPPTAPTVSIAAPTEGSTVSGVETISANASDAVAIASVQFQLDGVDLGVADTYAPYAFDWDTTTASDGVHTLRAIATNSVGLQTTSSEVTITVDNTVPAPVPPTVSITAPTAGSTIAGTQAISATAADTDGTVSSVQFQLDGANLGTAVTTAPYSINWDSTTVANGTHVLRAIATDNASLQTTSADVTVTVNNVAPPTTTEYVTNSSFETDLTQWTGKWSTNSQSSRVTGGYDGSYAIRSINTAATPTQHGFTSLPELLDGVTKSTVTGKVYTGSVWLKPGVVGQKISLYVRERNAAGTTVSSKTVTLTAANTNWSKLTNVYTAAGTGNRIAVTVWALTSAQNQGFMADQISFSAPN